MKRSLLFKVVALVGALLLGSAYVYDRAGGNLLPVFRYGQTIEAAPLDGASSGTIAPETFYGSKSAPVFQPLPAETGTLDASLMPGSKSAIVFVPGESEAPSTYDTGTPHSDAVETNDEPPPRLLPGSKSAGLFSPSSPPPPPPRAKAEVQQRQEHQRQAMSPKRAYGAKAETPPPSGYRGRSNANDETSNVGRSKTDRLLPGSKSDAAFRPSQSPPTPPTPPKANRARQPVPSQKSTSRRVLPGSKSRAVFEPREANNGNQANEPPRQQSANRP
jgi:hypothetical protein